MNSNINASDKENFWIKVYLKQQNDTFDALVEASIWRAYRDFSRTLHELKMFSKNEKIEKRRKLGKLMYDIANEVLIKKFSSQEDFDKWHEEKCKLLKSYFREIFEYENIYIGQCQKWINMTLKYLFMLGEDKIKGIETNYRFFHFPVDNIIQNEFLDRYQIKKLSKSWSRIEEYNEYLDYQKSLRHKIGDKTIPLEVEIKLFNSAIRPFDDFNKGL